MKIYEETGAITALLVRRLVMQSFLRKHDNLDFVEAVELLASYVGMEILNKNDIYQLRIQQILTIELPEIFINN